MKLLMAIILNLIVLGAKGEAQPLSDIIFSSKDASHSLELYHSLKLYPVKRIEIKDAVYHISELFKFDTSIPSVGTQRYGVFALVEVNGKKYFRFYYKSGSHGVFRLAPFLHYFEGENYTGNTVVSIMWYSKGIGEGSLALPPKLQIYLAKEISRGSYRNDITIHHIFGLIASHNDFVEKLPDESYDEYFARRVRLFDEFRAKQDELMAKEVQFVTDLLLKPVLEERSYVYKGEERKDFFAIPESVSFKKLEYLPDYTAGLLSPKVTRLNIMAKSQVLSIDL